MSIWIDHIGIACEANEVSKRFWELLGFTDSGTDENEEQGVKINFMKGDVAPQPKIELLEPLGPDTPVGKFIDKKGPGIHHLALEVDDIEQSLAKAKKNGLEPIGEAPRPGADNTLVAFFHPKDTGGVLLEIVQCE